MISHGYVVLLGPHALSLDDKTAIMEGLARAVGCLPPEAAQAMTHQLVQPHVGCAHTALSSGSPPSGALCEAMS